MPAPVRTIALINQKGGVGKTTTTVNLAAAVAAAGRRVLLVDLDPQAHATLHLGLDPGTPASKPSVYDVLHDPAQAKAALKPARQNLWVIPSETDLAAAETELSQEPDRYKRLAAALDSLEGDFEFVFLDCPPSLGLLTLSGLTAAREVFIPMQAHFLALQGVSKLLQTVQLVTKGVNPRLAVTGVILCMFDAATSHSQEVVKDLEAFFTAARQQDVPWKHARVFRPPIRRNIKLAECPSFGQTIFDYAPTAPGAADYAQLAKLITSEWDQMLARRSASDPAVVVAPAAHTAGRSA